MADHADVRNRVVGGTAEISVRRPQTAMAAISQLTLGYCAIDVDRLSL